MQCHGLSSDPATGTLAAFQTLDPPRQGTARNTCSQIHLTASGQFLYVGNRGHNSLAGFAVDAATGQLTALEQVATEAVPSAFGLDPTDHFVFAAGTASGRLASYRINGETGALTPLATYAVGQRPTAVLVTRLGGWACGVPPGEVMSPRAMVGTPSNHRLAGSIPTHNARGCWCPIQGLRPGSGS